MLFSNTFLAAILLLSSSLWRSSLLVAAGGKITTSKVNDKIPTMEMLPPDRAHRMVHGIKPKDHLATAATVKVDGMTIATTTSTTPPPQEERFAQGRVVAGFRLLPGLVEGLNILIILLPLFLLIPISLLVLIFPNRRTLVQADEHSSSGRKV